MFIAVKSRKRTVAVGSLLDALMTIRARLTVHDREIKDRAFDAWAEDAYASGFSRCAEHSASGTNSSAPDRILS